MAQYILDALSGNHEGARFGTLKLKKEFTVTQQTSDLALKVALETLGMRVFVSEADHPVLCECIRRQRGDLAMSLLLRYRDSIERLGVILDKVLDLAVHQMYRCFFN